MPTSPTGWWSSKRRPKRRRTDGDPDWARGACLHRAVVASIQRFQVGESGDGAGLISKADRAGEDAGLIDEADKAENDAYSAAVRLFVAEEQNHARLLAAAGAPTLAGHWSDTASVG